jgi:anti-anti-sigma regulatory factor
MANAHKLPGELTIYAAGSLRAQFEKWVAKLPKGRRAVALAGTALPVDASGVNEVDAAGLQLLLSLSKSLGAHKRSLQLVDPSTPLRSACDTLGLSGVLIRANQPGASS